jgi:hypothetical protein
MPPPPAPESASAPAPYRHSFGRELPDFSSRQEVHHHLIAFFHGSRCTVMIVVVVIVISDGDGDDGNCGKYVAQ